MHWWHKRFPRDRGIERRRSEPADQIYICIGVSLSHCLNRGYEWGPGGRRRSQRHTGTVGVTGSKTKFVNPTPKQPNCEKYNSNHISDKYDAKKTDLWKIQRHVCGREPFDLVYDIYDEICHTKIFSMCIGLRTVWEFEIFKKLCLKIQHADGKNIFKIFLNQMASLRHKPQSRHGFILPNHRSLRRAMNGYHNQFFRKTLFVKNACQHNLIPVNPFKKMYLPGPLLGSKIGTLQ